MILKDKLKRADLLLLLLFVAMAVIILFRINVESTGYLTPDSMAYLGLAQNIKDGHGFYVLNEAATSRHYFSTWPVGYPTIIALFSEITQLDVYWASKLLNLLFLGIGFLVLRHICRPYSFVLASLYGAYTYLEVYSFTWSEAPFLLGILLLAYFTNQVWCEVKINSRILLIFLICIALFFLRYVGAFSFGVPALLGVYFAYNRKYKTASKLFVVTVLLAFLAAAYLYTNYRLSGFITGFDRLEEETEKAGGFALMLLEGFLNEFLIIRKYRLPSQPDYLLYATIALQLLVLAYITVLTKRHYSIWHELKGSSFSIICLIIAFLYSIAILSLRMLSHFDDLDYRLLSPFSFPVFVGLASMLVNLRDSHHDVVRAKYALFVFLVVSLLLNLPKNYMLSQVQQFMR